MNFVVVARVYILVVLVYLAVLVQLYPDYFTYAEKNSMVDYREGVGGYVLEDYGNCVVDTWLTSPHPCRPNHNVAIVNSVSLNMYFVGISCFIITGVFWARKKGLF
jgi:hypothetical protein